MGKKIMLSVFWDIKGILYFEFLEDNETIDSLSYSQQLIKLNKKLFEERPALYNRKKIYLLHDNTKPHVSETTSETIRDLGFEVLPHPPSSSDLAPTDYYLFRHLQFSLRDKEFKNSDDVKNHVFEFFNSKSSSFFEKGIKKLPIRWQKCIDSEGNYFDF